MRRNRSGLPKYCSWNKDRHGTRRVRFRKSGFSTYLTGIPYGDDFMRQYYGALEGVKTQSDNIAAERTKPGSFDALCVAYYRSKDFFELRDSTKKTYRGVLERLRLKVGKLPVRQLERRHVKKIISDMKETPQAANRVLSMLNILLDMAMDLGLITQNPARGVKGFKKKTKGFHSWTDDEIAQFERHHPLGTKAYLALALHLYTAQRRSDVVMMGWQHVKDQSIVFRQQKTGTLLSIPISPKLQEALNLLPKSELTFLLTSQGKPFSANGYGNWFRERAQEAGLEHCTSHGLRKAAARRLAEAGCSADIIMSLTGHQSLKEVSVYTAAADQRRLATQAIQHLESTSVEQNLSSPTK